MSIQIIGSGGTIANVDGTTYRALRVTVRPVEFGEAGTYRISGTTGQLGSISNQTIFSAQWTNPTLIALVWGVLLDSTGSGIQNPALFGNYQLYVARQFTSPTTGGTTLTIPGNPPNYQRMSPEPTHGRGIDRNPLLRRV
jgi:hypothetical protein